MTLDALHPLEHWGDMFAGREIMLRVDLGRGLGHHEKVRTGGSGSKFGLPLDQLEAFLELAACHVTCACAACMRTWARASSMPATGARSTPSWPRWPSASAAWRCSTSAAAWACPRTRASSRWTWTRWIAVLAEVKAAYPQYRLWMEPGRYLVAEAGVLLARVTQDKRKGAHHYLGIDAGMHNLIRPALYEAWHDIVNLTRLDEPSPPRCTRWSGRSARPATSSAPIAACPIPRRAT